MLIGSVGTIFIVKVAILNRMVWPGVGVMISKLLGLFSMEYLVRVTSGTLAIASSFKATMRRCFIDPGLSLLFSKRGLRDPDCAFAYPVMSA